MTVQQLIDALTALLPESADLPVILKGNDAFLFVVQAVTLEGAEVIIFSLGR